MTNPIFMGHGQFNPQSGLVTATNRKGVDAEFNGFELGEGRWEFPNLASGVGFEVEVGQSGPSGNVTHINAIASRKDGQLVSNGLTVVHNTDGFIVLDGDRSGFQPCSSNGTVLKENA